MRQGEQLFAIAISQARHSIRRMEGLKSSEQEAREIVDAIPQSIAVLSPDGQPLYGNRSLLQYTGLTIAEMTSAEFRARVFHPEDVARLREERRDALARGVPFELEQRARRWNVAPFSEAMRHAFFRDYSPSWRQVMWRDKPRPTASRVC